MNIVKKQKLVTLLKIASQSYNDEPSETITNIDENNIEITYKLINKYNKDHNRFCIYANGENNANANRNELIVGISGTDELYDTLMDLYIRPYEVYNSDNKNKDKDKKVLFTTYGQKIMYNLIKKDIKMQIKNNLTYIKKISIIGHSLGGSISTMLLLDLISDFDSDPNSDPNSATDFDTDSNFNFLGHIQQNQIHINLITYNSAKFFATHDKEKGYTQPNTFINELIKKKNLSNNINILNIIKNDTAPSEKSYDYDYNYDLVSLLTLSNIVFRHICDKENNIYLLNTNTNSNSIEKKIIYGEKTNADESKPFGIINTIRNYAYYIYSLPFKYYDIRQNHSIDTILEYFEKTNFNFDALPKNL